MKDPRGQHPRTGVLLDTHVALWAYGEPERLSTQALRLIETASTSIYISVVTAQEIVIKNGLGKLPLDDSPERWLVRMVDGLMFRWLPLLPTHAFALARLPLYRDHRDPFDRQLIAQAQVEALTLVTRDARIIDGRYDIPLLIA